MQNKHFIRFQPIPIFRYFRISPMEIPSMFYDFVEVAPDASEGID